MASSNSGIPLQLEGHSKVVTGITLLPDGRAFDTLITSCKDGQLRVFDSDTGGIKRTYSKHLNRVGALAVLGGDIIASGDDDGVISLWRASTGECLYFEKQGSGEIEAITKLNDSRFVVQVRGKKALVYYKHVSGGEGQNGAQVTMRAVQRKDGRYCKLLVAFETKMVTVISNLSSTSETFTGDEEQVILWDWETGKKLVTLQKKFHWVSSLSMNSNALVTGTGSSPTTGKLLIWDPETYELLHEVSSTGRVYSPIILENYVVVGSSDKNIRVIDLTTGETSHRFTAKFPAHHLAVKRDGRLVVANNLRNECLIFSGHEKVTEKLAVLASSTYLDHVTTTSQAPGNGAHGRGGRNEAVRVGNQTKSSPGNNTETVAGQLSIIAGLLEEQQKEIAELQTTVGGLQNFFEGRGDDQ